jgi:hypothetical protein
MKAYFMKAYALAALAAAASLAIAGCQSTLNQDVAQFNAAVASDLPTACALVASANASFQAVAATGTLKASVTATEKQAYAGASSICANPSSVNASTALQTLANAYAAIVQAGQQP